MQTLQQRALQQSKLQVFASLRGEGLPQGASGMQARQSPHLKQSSLSSSGGDGGQSASARHFANGLCQAPHGVCAASALSYSPTSTHSPSSTAPARRSAGFSADRAAAEGQRRTTPQTQMRKQTLCRSPSPREVPTRTLSTLATSLTRCQKLQRPKKPWPGCPFGAGLFLDVFAGFHAPVTQAIAALSLSLST